jgi:hypothetical protein
MPVRTCGIRPGLLAGVGSEVHPHPQEVVTVGFVFERDRRAGHRDDPALEEIRRLFARYRGISLARADVSEQADVRDVHEEGADDVRAGAARVAPELAARARR